MRIKNCPKRLNNCDKQCPLYPCWAYEDQIEKENKKSKDGWE